jgi:hypothetical protein
MSLSKSQKVDCPIILIDCSGSTLHEINVKNHYKSVDTVLKFEIAKAQEILTSYGITHAYVIMWNYTGRVCSQTPILVSEFTKIRAESLGGTCLTKGLEAIPEEWLKNKTCKELYIFTDGEIEDDGIILNPLKKLIDFGVKIQIITIEPNSTNYVETKAEAGCKLFQAAKSNGLTSSIRRFSSYNEYHVLEPFISFDNPEIIEGFTPFQGKYYDIDTQEDELINKVEKAIGECETTEEIAKLAHELTITVQHMIKDKPVEKQIEINNQFSDLFAESPIEPSMFAQVNHMLLLETTNLSNGNGTTYHEFKDALILYSQNS